VLAFKKFSTIWSFVLFKLRVTCSPWFELLPLPAGFTLIPICSPPLAFSLRLIVICSLLALPRFRTTSPGLEDEEVLDVLPEPLPKFKTISGVFEPVPFPRFKTISGPDAGLALGVVVVLGVVVAGVVVLGVVPTVEVMGEVVVLAGVVDVTGELARVLVVSTAVPFPLVKVMVIAGPALVPGLSPGCFRKELYNLA
jgi:hypothetical protein